MMDLSNNGHFLPGLGLPPVCSSPPTTRSLSSAGPPLVSSEDHHPHALPQSPSPSFPPTIACPQILSPQRMHSASVPTPLQSSSGGPLVLSATQPPGSASPCYTGAPWPSPSYCLWAPQWWQTPQLWGLVLPCCVRGDPDVAEAAGFWAPAIHYPEFPHWPGGWLASLVIHGPTSVPGGSLHPHINRPSGVRGEDISGQTTPTSHPPAHLEVRSLKLPHWSPSLPPHCRHLLRFAAPPRPTPTGASTRA